ncbi:bifunctional phosphopantothenoylcysteine decarboxylase/phosphopantothenate--cysteine ligase CoaBC [Aestuariibacter halophilus]|uniref:Coenzyme A biosynthesis bifunctional protein CoaBC n=1 Tax=Fluctibacter halophilus TaxID=226011 RepID=A0ABS8GA85_9ALTE|nr:bifunctional phosphopantothenoylcysteine decarboxylase/phosphopantothenate--cysteine ligase CoaBC [Aestuariibacter halophilus]MCC2617504.1 bifunctional phosphopantothenoylcysteine decarboxylase/phosphopantothenate--cysteine ligase CoaBC [Aestuariibacter halophilus]
MSLCDKNVLLGISGGIAAYKAPDLVRKLRAQGANVRVVMTASAAAFVSPLSLQAVCGHPVSQDLLDPAAEAAMGHIELAKWADVLLIAPATANILAKLAHGLADDLLSTLCLATQAPIHIAPAMNQQMWRAPATQANLALLHQRQITFHGPAEGEQACGDIGPGRMLEPEALVAALAGTPPKGPLSGKRILITAGPTREAIDPVRYMSNHSSGKMGYALAQQAVRAGAQVTLVSGPVSLPTPGGVHRIDVISAADMHEAVMQHAKNNDVFIACAAVADYRAADQQPQKIKKNQQELTLTFVKNPDILADVAKMQQGPFTVGFAAETQDVAHYAKDKLQRKGLDMIAANDVSDSRIGFNADQNALHVFWSGGDQLLPVASKLEVASALLTLIQQRMSACQ